MMFGLTWIDRTIKPRPARAGWYCCNDGHASRGFVMWGRKERRENTCLAKLVADRDSRQ